MRIWEYKAVVWIDAMWWEWGPNIMVPSIQRLSKLHPDVLFVAFWTQEDVHDRLKGTNIGSVVTANDITDDAKYDSKISVVKGALSARESAIVQMLDQLKEWELDATISRWNTAAYGGYAISKMKKQWVSPALSCWIPRVDMSNPRVPQRDALLMDVWATFDTTPDILLNNAHLWVKALGNNNSTKIALLNAWEEAYKGDKAYVDGYKLLVEQFWDRFIGNIEPNCILTDTRPDLIVTGWMFGNGVLKWMEGTFQTTAKQIKTQAFWSYFDRFMWFYTWWKIKKGLWHFNPDLRWDGVFHGLDIPEGRMVVKIHGSASEKGVIETTSSVVKRILSQKTED